MQRQNQLRAVLQSLAPGLSRRYSSPAIDVFAKVRANNISGNDIDGFIVSVLIWISLCVRGDRRVLFHNRCEKPQYDLFVILRTL